MMINKDKVSLYLNKDTSRQEFANVGTINLGNKTVNKDGTTNPGPVSVFSNIYKWDEYKDINNTGSGSNGVASKSLLYTMTVKAVSYTHLNDSTLVSIFKAGALQLQRTVHYGKTLMVKTVMDLSLILI